MAVCGRPLAQLHRQRTVALKAHPDRPVLGESFRKLVGSTWPGAVDHEWLLIG